MECTTIGQIRKDKIFLFHIYHISYNTKYIWGSILGGIYKRNYFLTIFNIKPTSIERNKARPHVMSYRDSLSKFG